MSERKKVIAALSECNPFNQCYEERCPYYKDNNCLGSLHEDVLKLLKEQEPIKPYVDSFNNDCWWATECCGTPINFKTDKFCPKCGRPIKWDV